MSKKYILVFLFAPIIVGCSTPSIYISSNTDKNYSVDKTKRISIFCNEEDPIEKRNLCYMVKSEMEHLGFNIVSSPPIDFVLIVDTDEKTSQISSYLPLSTPSSTYGNIGGYQYTEHTNSTTYVPYSYNYTVAKIYLDLFVAEKISEKKYITAWEGYIGADKNVFLEYSKDCIYTLLQYFGDNYKGHVNILSNNNRDK